MCDGLPLTTHVCRPFCVFGPGQSGTVKVQRGLSGAADCQDGRTRHLSWLLEFMQRNIVETLSALCVPEGASYHRVAHSLWIDAFRSYAQYHDEEVILWTS